MSKYIRKQDLLEWLSGQNEFRRANLNLELVTHIISGTFDAEDDSQRYRDALVKAEKFISAVLGFYGQNLQVYGWHQNGDGEPWDNFFDENMDGDELEVIRAALAGAEKEEANA